MPCLKANLRSETGVLLLYQRRTLSETRWPSPAKFGVGSIWLRILHTISVIRVCSSWAVCNWRPLHKRLRVRVPLASRLGTGSLLCIQQYSIFMEAET